MLLWIENPRVGSSILPLATIIFFQSCFRAVTITMTGYKEIGASELHAMLEHGKPLLVDVRNDDEVARGIIGGAQHIPLSLLPIMIDELDGDAPIVFYCHSGIRSAQACAFMANKGRANLFNLQGGVLAWGKAGYPFSPKN